MLILGWIIYVYVAFTVLKNFYELRMMIHASVSIAPQLMNSLSYRFIGLILLPIFGVPPIHILWVYLVVKFGLHFLHLFPFNIITPVSALLYSIAGVVIIKKD